MFSLDQDKIKLRCARLCPPRAPLPLLGAQTRLLAADADTSAPALGQGHFVLLGWFLVLLSLFSSSLLQLLAGASAGNGSTRPCPHRPLGAIVTAGTWITQSVLHQKVLPDPHHMPQSGFHTNTTFGSCHLIKSVSWFRLKFHLKRKLPCSSLTGWKALRGFTFVEGQHPMQVRTISLSVSGPARGPRPRQLL